MNNFVYIPIIFAIGIGTYFALPSEPNLWITLGIIEALIILAIISRYHPYHLKILGYIAIFVLGFANIQLKSHYLSQIKPIKNEQTIYINGQVEYKDYNSKGSPRYTLTNIKDFNNKQILDKIRVSASGTNFMIGDCFETVIKIMPPYKPPFYGAYDFSKKAFYSGLQGNGYAITHAYKTKCKNNKTPIIANLRENIIKKINQNIQKPQSSVASALIAGEKGKIPQKLLEQYRDSGLAHVLSISGMHMSMIAGLMFALIRTILACIPSIALKYNIKKTSAFIAILAATFYLLISGSSIPTQRAYIMVFIVLLGVLFDRTAISIKNIAIAAMIILIISPEVLTSPSFQMSFAAVLAMISFYESYATKINQCIKKYGYIISFITGLLIADFIASIATLPFAIYHFNKIAIYTTLGNLLAGPIISFIIMPFILFSFISMPIGLEPYCLKIVGFGIKLINNITSYVSSLDGATIQLLSMPTWAFISIIIGGLIICILKNKLRIYGLVPIFIGFISLFFLQTPQSININSPSKFEETLIKQKYGNIKINNQKPYGAVVYKNHTKTQKLNRIWHK